ncbi:hypothetical protein JW898_04605 [Candidatus Woesearchaeota archaeon]|nr:hypothetical protein [Candidatus Woesearchaeota archaeon]
MGVEDIPEYRRLVAFPTRVWHRNSDEGLVLDVKESLRQGGYWLHTYAREHGIPYEQAEAEIRQVLEHEASRPANIEHLRLYRQARETEILGAVRLRRVRRKRLEGMFELTDEEERVIDEALKQEPPEGALTDSPA